MSYDVVDLGSNTLEDTSFGTGCGVTLVRPRDTAVQRWRAREAFVTTNQQNEINLYIYIYFTHTNPIYKHSAEGKLLAGFRLENIF